MNSHLIMRMLGKFFAILAIPSLFCAMWAISNDRYQQASLFIILVTGLAVLASILLIAVPRPKAENAGLKDVVTFLLLAWLGLSVFGSIPLVMVADGQLSLALFEAVSCATTTGASLLTYDEPLSATLVAWRGILHFIGAALSISGTILLLSMSASRGDLGGQRIRAKSLGVTVRLASFTKLFFSVCGVIGLLFVVPFTELLLSNLSMREAFAFSVGAATTGQVLPYDVSTDMASRPSGLLLALILLIASTDTGALLSVPREKWKVFRDKETVWLVLIFLSLVAILLFHQKDAGIVLILSEAASIVSTSGLMLPPEKVEAIGIPVLIFFGFVGGSAISATGGMKIFRLRMLSARTGQEFARLAQPNAIMSFQKSSSDTGVDVMMAVWVYFLGFAVVAVALASYLAILGLDFDSALTVSTGAITNSAALFRTDLLGEYNNTLTQLILTLSMIFGRLELLLLLSLVFRA